MVWRKGCNGELITSELSEWVFDKHSILRRTLDDIGEENYRLEMLRDRENRYEISIKFNNEEDLLIFRLNCIGRLEE